MEIENVRQKKKMVKKNEHLRIIKASPPSKIDLSPETFKWAEILSIC